ncbi:LysE family translocator [Agrobacterium vitis]|uniref:LysE family translocator n=1 Tax=Agrobacterium vitis TaxID=373 RepID=A0ABD6GEM0_AGRVI|nr:LysE family translocator [Agrobacterium vitis]MUO80054.1 LysE family translocator [Agrobacterium vitis]MUO97220.1 LysE family translocator [Agrobacterium vitis]MUP07765.1 LysE family translocator [Agrobacterium vitis]MUZ82490.1 LysE family translocator [Agrobacterium vitis]MVA12877.1 LysE family translocator [Agrobacterium vitis]
MDLLSIAIFAGALLLNAGTPGPSIAALVSRVLTSGWRDVIPFVAAMWIGEVIWLTMAMAGLTALAQTFQFGFHVLKWLGVAYLCWLAFKMWRMPMGGDADNLPRRSSQWSMFGAGMALTLGNPKIMVFYLALLPSLIDLSATGVREWAILAIVTLVTLAAIDLTWTFFAHKARLLLRTPRATRLANRLGAVALGGAAAAIATRN